MTLLEHPQNRFIFLVEQLRLSILSGKSIAETIKYFSQKSEEFVFLKELNSKIEQGKALSDAIREQKNIELSAKVKTLLDALDSGNFAAQKLEELRDSLLKDKKENFENVSASLTSKLGWLAFCALIPVGVYFLSTLGNIFESIGMGALVISSSIKIIVLFVCAVIFAIMLFSKRVKNG